MCFRVFADTATEDQLTGPSIAKLNKNSAFVLDPIDIPEVGIQAGDKINFLFNNAKSKLARL